MNRPQSHQRRVRQGAKRVTAVLATGLFATTGLATVVLPDASADAAVSSSQQWFTSLTGGTANGGTMTGTFGTTGVTAAVTAVGNLFGMPAPMGGDTSGNALLSPGAPNGQTPWVLQSALNQSATATVTFDKPVIGPEIHVLNIDGSIARIAGTTTAGAPITLARLSGNTVFTASPGGFINQPPRRAAAGGCQNDDGSNPSGACGSARLEGGPISSFSLLNSESGNGGDGWHWGLSFPTAPLTKQFSPARIAVGGTSHLTFTIANPANEAQPTLTPLGFTDTLPAGVTLKDATVADNGDCGSQASVTLTAGGTTITAGGISVAAGATCTITVDVTAAQPGTYTNDDNNLSTTVANLLPNASTTLTAVTPSYTVSKAVGSAATSPGGTVTYAVTVTNTGSVDYTTDAPASFTDDLSGMLDDASYNGDASGGASVTGSTLSWSGPLAVGATQVIGYSVTVARPDTGDHALVNRVTPTGEGGTCVPGACSTITPVADFTVSKSVDRTTVVPGQRVTYAVTVTNTGQVPYTAADPARFTDDLSAVVDDADYAGDATGGATVTGNTLTWVGALAVGATRTVTYSFIVKDTDTGDGVLTNTVDPVGGSCASPGACSTRVPQASYTVAKTASAATAVAGDIIAYAVTVTNTGSSDYTAEIPASFRDDLSDVLDDAVYNGDATAGATVTGTMLSWSGPLAVGASETIRYSVTVASPSTGDLTLVNAVVPTGEGGVCESSDSCITRTPSASFAVTKSASTTAAVGPGARVTYTITVRNTGTAAYTPMNPASFVDDMSDVLDDATYDGDASSGAAIHGTTLRWSGALAVGAVVTVTYSVTIDSPDAGNHDLVNTAAPAAEGGSCIMPGGCAAETPIQQAPDPGPQQAAASGLASTGTDSAGPGLLGALLIASGLAIARAVAHSRRRTKQ